MMAGYFQQCCHQPVFWVESEHSYRFRNVAMQRLMFCIFSSHEFGKMGGASTPRQARKQEGGGEGRERERIVG